MRPVRSASDANTKTAPTAKPRRWMALSPWWFLDGADRLRGARAGGGWRFGIGRTWPPMDSCGAAGRRRVAGASRHRGKLLGNLAGCIAARGAPGSGAPPARHCLAVGHHGNGVDRLVPDPAVDDGQPDSVRNNGPGMALGDGQRGVGESHLARNPGARPREPVASRAWPRIAD